MASLTIDALLELWLADLQANDLAPGTARGYIRGHREFSRLV